MSQQQRVLDTFSRFVSLASLGFLHRHIFELHKDTEILARQNKGTHRESARHLCSSNFKSLLVCHGGHQLIGRLINLQHQKHQSLSRREIHNQTQDHPV
jgi:hypothetical protein